MRISLFIQRCLHAKTQEAAGWRGTQGVGILYTEEGLSTVAMAEQSQPSRLKARNCLPGGRWWVMTASSRNVSGLE